MQDIPNLTALDHKSPTNTGERHSSQKPSTPQDGAHGTSEVSSGGTEATAPAPGLSRIKLKSDDFGDGIDAAYAPRKRLSLQPRSSVTAHDRNQSATAELEPPVERARAEMRQVTDRFDAEWQQLKQTIHRYEDELSNLRRELQDAKDLASVRGKKLADAEAFLTADALSISEIILKVVTLNEEIFQAAAFLSETLVCTPHDITEEEEFYALGVAQGLIGDKILYILCEHSRKEAPEAHALFVQVVFQIFLVTYCSQLVQSWSNDAACSSFMAAAYAEIRNVEGQAISGRWRSFTRKHTCPTTDSWKEDLVRKFRSVLRVASWSWMAPSVEQRKAFEQKLEPIFRAVEDLRNAIGEKFISADLEVAAVEPDQVFQPVDMEDEYGDSNGNHAPQEVVLGTTGVGLRNVVPQRSAKGEVVYENLLSAKVVLASTLIQALHQ